MPPQGYYYPPPGYYYPPPGYYPYPPPTGDPEGASNPPVLSGPPPSETVAAGTQPSAPGAAAQFSFGATLATSLESETNATSVIISPLLEGAYALYPLVLLDLVWGFGWAVDGEGLVESTTRAGNPMFSVHLKKHTDHWRLRAGLGITAPLASIPLSPDGRLYAFVINQTMAMWGMWNQWLWSPGRMAVPTFARATYVFANGHQLSAEVAIAPLIGATNGASGTYLVGQFAVEAQLAIGASFALCPRLQTVLLPSAGIDRWQSAAGLRGLLQTRYGRFFASILLNLDEPLGVFSGLERWGFHLGKEVDL
jgi:hypothetical protein